VALASRFASRARTRRSARVPSRAQRRAAAPRPAAGASLLYRKALRALARRFRSIVDEVLDGVLHHVSHGDSLRTDAVGPSELRRRLTSAIASRLDLSHLERLTGEIASRTERKAQQEVARLVPRLTLRSQIPGGEYGVVQAWRRENVDLIRTLFERQTRRLEAILENNEFLRVEDLADRIQSVLGVTESKADLLSRDQSLRLSSQVTVAKQRSAGITKFIWSTTGDERVRESHEELDGQTFSYDDPPVVDGEAILPGQAYGCRCVPYPVVSLLDDPDLD
jgi:SPP1 gp7 family putative phage head morphogenesis protein